MAQGQPFHEQLKRERELRGWSQARLAKEIGCDLKTARRWERGETLPQAYYRPCICGLFGKNAEELGLLGEQENTPHSTDAGSEQYSGKKTALPPQDKDVVVYNIHPKWVVALAWEPCGTRIASAGGDGTVHIWDTNTGRHLRIYRGHESKGVLAKTPFLPTVYAVAWAPDRQRIASAGDGKTVHIWNPNTGATLLKYTRHSGIAPNVYAVAWSPDGTRIASACSSVGIDKTVHIWDAITGETLLRYDTHAGWTPSFSVLALDWSPDGTCIASTCSDSTVRIWDADNGKHLATYTTPSDWVRDLAWSPDSEWLAVANGDDTIQIWNTTTGRIILTYSGHTDSVRNIAWSPDGTCIASASNDTTVQIWDATTGNALYIYEGHKDWATAVAWSPDGNRIASASNDKTVRIWQPAIHVISA